MRWWLKIRKRRSLERDVQEEIAFHRAMRERDAAGSATEVPRFGNETQILEEVYDMWSFVPLETAWRDARHGLRGLRRNPGFTVVAILTLAIGIGATTAVFSVVNGIVIKPLPYPDADRLVGVWQMGTQSGATALNCSPSMYFTYREENRTFEEFGLAAMGEGSVTGLAQPEQVRMLNTTYGTLQALGMQPVIGRLFSEADDTPDGADPDTVIVSYRYWQSHFGDDTSILGRGLTVDSTPRRIIGVMPAGFRFLDLEPDLITPARFDRNRVFRGNLYLQGIARLKPGVTLAQANADLERMLEIWTHAWPAPPGQTLVEWHLKPALRPLKQDVIGDTGNALWVVMGTISMVLLIACANVANLLFVRTQSRRQELAVRAALGASRRRITAGLLVESILLSLIGGAVGVGLAYVGLRLLIRTAPENLPRLSELAIDLPTLGFAFCASLVSALLFSLLPVLRAAAGARVATALRSMGRSSSQSKERHRASNVLVVAQTALALILLISAGLMIRTFQALRDVVPGFTKPQSIQILRISLPNSQFEQPEQVIQTEIAIRDKLAEVPGVTAVAFSNTVPLDGRRSLDPVWAQDKVYPPGQNPPIRVFRYVSPGFFAAMGTRLRAGRDITQTEFQNRSSVALVSENMARELWGSPAKAVGKRIHEPGPNPSWREVVGVVEDVRNRGAQFEPSSIAYFPAAMENGYGKPLYVQREVAYTIRTDRAGAQSLLAEARAAVWSVNSNLPVFLESTMKNLYDRSLAATSFTLVMLAIAGTMALLLGIVGIYGVMSYAVSQRTHEMAIRLALGAKPRELTQAFVGNGLALAGAGIVIGLAGAAGLTSLMKSLLFGISTLDPVIYFGMTAVLLAAAVLASYLPARRASRIDPSEALRLE